jgi:DNA-binding NtrC family response regulator
MQVQPSLPSSSTQREKTAILIVDDDTEILTIFKKSLELAGYSTYGFSNPVAALEHFRRNSRAYQIVISDIRMPGMSGFQLIREIRRMNKDVKIILTSAFEISMSEFRTVLPSLRIDGLVEKPIGLDKLKTIINSVAQ